MITCVSSFLLSFNIVVSTCISSIMFYGIRKHLDILWSQERLGNWHILQKKKQENKTNGPKRYSYHTKITDAHFISFKGCIVLMWIQGIFRNFDLLLKQISVCFMHL